MGGLSSSLGFAGGDSGSGRSMTAANVINPVTSQMTTDAYNTTQTGLNNQQAFLQALQAQNGIANQSSVYNQLQGVANGTGPNPAKAELAQATNQNVANQAALMAGQRGSGANVGLMARQVANQGANTQQQAAGQAATMQANQSLNALNSMGSMATNQVSQQANATNAYSSAAQGEQANLYNMLSGVNSNNTSSANTINSANAQLIGQSINNQNGYMSSIGSMLMGGSGKAEGGMIKSYADGGGVSYGGAQAGEAPAPSAIAAITANHVGFSTAADKADQMANSAASMGKSTGDTSKSPEAQSMAGGPGDAGAAPAGNMDAVAPMGTMLAADGGEVPTEDNKDDVSTDEVAKAVGVTPPSQEAAKAQPTLAAPQQKEALATDPSGPQSSFGQAIQSVDNQSQSYGGAQAAPGAQSGSTAGIAANHIGFSTGADKADSMGQSVMQGIGSMGGMAAMAMARGGKVPAMVSPGEQYLPPKDVKKVVKDGKDPLKTGQRVPGRPMYPGNDYRNDIVPAKLETGGIVIPNKVMQSSDPAGNAKKFIEATLRKERGNKKAK